MTEAQLQALCTRWFWNTYPSQRRMLLCVDNNSFNMIEGNRKKALGVVRGASDLILIAHGSVLFVELKVGRGTTSAYQDDFAEKVMSRGHLYLVIRTFDDFKDLVCKTIGPYSPQAE